MNDEDDEISWVEYQFRALPSNRGEMWTPRMVSCCVWVNSPTAAFCLNLFTRGAQL